MANMDPDMANMVNIAITWSCWEENAFISAYRHHEGDSDNFEIVVEQKWLFMKIKKTENKKRLIFLFEKIKNKFYVNVLEFYSF